jgi:hypothetical protein
MNLSALLCGLPKNFGSIFGCDSDLHSVETGSGSHPVGYGQADHFCLLLRQKICGATPPFPHTSS